MVGPLPTRNGKNMLLTIIDRTSGWPEAIPLISANAKHCTEILLQNWISRFRVPQTIASYRGPQFISKVWDEMCRILNIKIDRTTSYHPQHNGKIERMHRTLKHVEDKTKRKKQIG